MFFESNFIKNVFIPSYFFTGGNSILSRTEFFQDVNHKRIITSDGKNFLVLRA
jgi:hypothetical protein